VRAPLQEHRDGQAQNPVLIESSDLSDPVYDKRQRNSGEYRLKGPSLRRRFVGSESPAA
jgi:hypothetical protein